MTNIIVARLLTPLLLPVLLSSSIHTDTSALTSASVIGAQDGTTLTEAAQAFTKLRTAKPSTRPNIQSKQSGSTSQDHPSWGVFTDNLKVTGQQAYQSVMPNYFFDSDTVYAPTIAAPNSCIEVTTAYHAGEAPQVWVWDWCGTIGPGKSVKVDASFLFNYTTEVGGAKSYLINLQQTDENSNTWTAMLYNFKSKKWDNFYSQQGQRPSGFNSQSSWNIFEVYTSGPRDVLANYCTALASNILQSSGYRIKVNNQWITPDNTNSRVEVRAGNSSFRCGNNRLRLELFYENEWWKVSKNTP